MNKGKLYPSESRTFVDEKTGTTIRQVTNAEAIHHHPFFMIPAYDDAMQWLIFASSRTGKPQLFAEVRATGQLLQLTDRDDLSDWSIHPSHDGRYVYFTAGTGGWRVNLQTLAEEKLIDFGDVAMREQGMVAAAMGTTALSVDDRWWAIKYNIGKEACLSITDTQSGKSEIILRRDTIAHMQFCPDDPSLLFYAGPLTDRVWLINRDGSGNRRLYQRKAGEWITHETWIPGTRELAFVDWPHGVRSIQVDSGVERRVCSFNAWHAVSSQDGTRMVADTNFPDIGVQLCDPRDGVGAATTLCFPGATNMGAHWAGPFPYDNGPIEVYAPQHTHPHPTFSPDNRFVIFTSDRTGFAQIYEASVPAIPHLGAG